MRWDGEERRATVKLADELKCKETVDAPIVMVLVGFAAVLLLQAAALWGHGVIAHADQKRADAAARFEQRITCFIVRFSQNRQQGPEVLTDCGFLNTGGK
jgi:hypothetical protein